MSLNKLACTTGARGLHTINLFAQWFAFAPTSFYVLLPFVSVDLLIEQAYQVAVLDGLCLGCIGGIGMMLSAGLSDVGMTIGCISLS